MALKCERELFMLRSGHTARRGTEIHNKSLRNRQKKLISEGKKILQTESLPEVIRKCEILPSDAKRTLIKAHKNCKLNWNLINRLKDKTYYIPKKTATYLLNSHCQELSRPINQRFEEMPRCWDEAFLLKLRFRNEQKYNNIKSVDTMFKHRVIPETKSPKNAKRISLSNKKIELEKKFRILDLSSL